MNLNLVSRRIIFFCLFDSIDNIKILSSKYGCSIKEVAITWLVSKNYLTSAIIGFRNLEQSKEIIDILQKSINLEMLKEIDNLIIKDS